jgi:aminoglycoside 6'-N-acetyltransferase
MDLAFRRMTDADLPALHRWLQEPHVRAFYDDGLRTLEAVAAYHGDALHGREPTHLFFALAGGEPCAYLQTYRIADHPAYAAAVQVGPDDAAVDMLIGEPRFAHRGLGGPLLRRFVDDVVWSLTGAPACWIAPSPDNARAIRAYEKAGFAYVKTVDVPGSGAEYFMRLASRTSSDRPSRPA